MISEVFEDRMRLYESYIDAKRKIIEFLFEKGKRCIFFRTGTISHISYPKNKVLKDKFGITPISKKTAKNSSEMIELQQNWIKIEELLNSYPSIEKIDITNIYFRGWNYRKCLYICR